MFSLLPAFVRASGHLLCAAAAAAILSALAPLSSARAQAGQTPAVDMVAFDWPAPPLGGQGLARPSLQDGLPDWPVALVRRARSVAQGFGTKARWVASSSRSEVRLSVPEPPEANSAVGDDVSNDGFGGLHLQLATALRADIGTFPHQPAVGAQIQVAAQLAKLFVAVGATYWPAREQRSPLSFDARLYGSGLFTELGFGAALTATPFVVTPLLNVELGQLRAEAVGLQRTERNRLLWMALGTSLMLAAEVWRGWNIALEASGLVPIFDTHWLVRTPAGDAAAFDAQSVVWRLSLRMAYRLR